MNRRSLRFRIGVTFLVLAGLLSSIFAWAILLATERMESRYIESTLSENLELMIGNRTTRPESPLPRSNSVMGYAVPLDRTSELPHFLSVLGPGTYEHEDDSREYQIAVRDAENMRYVVTYDSTRLEVLTDRLEAVLAGGVVVFGLVAMWIGAWTADRIIAPVTNLARQIRALGDEVDSARLEVQWGDDEVAELASAFEHHLARVNALMHREREFTANVSHELRTPIMVASSGVDLLLEQAQLTDGVKQQLRRIRRAVRQMANLTDAFLILGREVEAPDPTAPHSTVEPTLREVIEFRRETAEQKQITIDLTVEGNATVRAPRTAVSVVLDNLIGNAVTHTAEGRVAVKLSEAGVTISDTGPGIPLDEQTRVFERDFRGRGAGRGGAGLGLSIVRALCDHYGWQVTLESVEGLGTTAHLEFPA